MSGLGAKGSLRSLPGGFDGRLALAGSGISGTLDFAPVGRIQRIEAHLKARDARLEGPPLLIARRGTLDGSILLDPAGTSIDGTVTGQGLSWGGINLARLAANAQTKGGVGEVRASFAGSRGKAFEFQTVAQVSPSSLRLIGSGTIDRTPIKLITPAQLAREGDGWRLQPASLAFAGGEAKVGGRFGGSAPEIDAQLSQMPLTVLNMLYPKLGLGGTASGSLSYKSPAGALPHFIRHPPIKTTIEIYNKNKEGNIAETQPG